MKKYGILILLMIAVNLCLYHYHQKYKRQTSKYLEILLSESEGNQMLRENLEISFVYNSTTLDSLLCTDVYDNLINIKNVINEKTKKILVCRFSELACESCIQFAIENIKKRSEEVGVDNIIFLCSYMNNKMLMRMIEIYNIEQYKVFNYNSLAISIDDWRKPYYFILDHNLTISDILIPQKTSHSLINHYFNSILDKHFKSSQRQ